VLTKPKADPGAASPEPSLDELKKACEADPEDALAALRLGKAHLTEGRANLAEPLLQRAAATAPSSTAWFALGSAQLALGKKAEGLASLKKALRQDRSNYIIRKQIWLIEHPDKFHPTIDWNWQREQLKKEREEEAKDPPSPAPAPLPDRPRSG
jgi:tetratricopeptide (TPR) repeat protein